MVEQLENGSQLEVWARIVCSAIFLLVYVCFLLLAVQVSRETGPGRHAAALSKVIPAIPFGVLSVVPLLTVLFRERTVSPVARRVAEGLLMLWGILTLCLYAQLG